MPDKPFTVITYAASASLAAIALVYFFNPNHLIDGESSSSSASTRKKTIVESYTEESSDSDEIYTSIPETDKDGNKKKLLSLQSGEVTKGLKDIIDHLNERPIYKKTISAGNFISVLEHAFSTRISKSQQDAQELLQIVAERLSDEYRAGKSARSRARRGNTTSPYVEVSVSGLGLSLTNALASNGPPIILETPSAAVAPPRAETTDLDEEEDGFPLEGKTLSQIECQHCHFIPKSRPINFVMLTLNVPQKSTTSLNECFDAHFKTEYIDDYKCDKCRLEHALKVFNSDFAKAKTDSERQAIKTKIELVEKAVEDDPEVPPEGIVLPDTKRAPTQRIARHVQITEFPKVLVIHLSRSIFDPRSSSEKNTAKVTFPERLPLGSLLNRRNYKLLGMVSHKGTHNSGHYESFRRQHLYAPISTPNVKHEGGPYSAAITPSVSRKNSQMSSRSSPRPSGIENNTLHPDASNSLSPPSTVSRSPSAASAQESSPSTRPSSSSISGTSIPEQDGFSKDILDTSKQAENTQQTRESSSTFRTYNPLEPSRLRRKKKRNDRWWRISDDKIRECSTAEVLKMESQVYMLFYETEKDDADM